MNARQQLMEPGYVILYKAVPDEFTNNLRSVARYDELSWSDGIWDGEAVDMQRTRAKLPDELSRVLSTLFRCHYLIFSPQSTANEWSIVKTIAGAPNQSVRRDFPPPQAGTDAVDLAAIPAELLVATQDDTVIHEFGWNRLVALRSNSDAIRLDKGDIIMFRGDFMHALAGFDINNICAHCYLDTLFYLEGSDRKLAPVIDDMSAIDDLFCYIYNCHFVASGTNSLRKHLNRFHNFFFARPRV
ncbi:hypothetical protein V7S43_018629 [Phytophthora oleae]|uniref:Uncharacterized protein n=1 Tax=Phytophthora oleae TaxID=2107226 RepID=A0ABD3ES19_9STRA